MPSYPNRQSGTPKGPRQFYECTLCGRRITRKNRDSKLQAHKDKQGGPCAGRTGLWIDT